MMINSCFPAESRSTCRYVRLKFTFLLRWIYSVSISYICINSQLFNKMKFRGLSSSSLGGEDKGQN